MQNTALRHSIGRDWKAALEPELQKLKPSDRELLGAVAAVVIRSDRFLGRPEEDCEIEECYIIMYPSKYSVVCNKDVGTLSNAGSDYKIISFNYFVDQVLEFNFTFLQMLYTDGILYQTDEFKQLREKVNKYISEDAEARNRFACKLNSLMHGVYKGLDKIKKSQEENSEVKAFDPKIFSNRMFLILKAHQVLTYLVKDKLVVINYILDMSTYKRMNDSIYSQDCGSKALIELKDMMKEYSEFGNVKDLDKQDIRLAKLAVKYDIMIDIVKKVIIGD